MTSSKDEGVSRLIEVFGWACSVSVRLGSMLLTFDGGGDFKRGDVGHEGVFCPDLCCRSFADSSTPSRVLRSGFEGESARCMTVEGVCEVGKTVDEGLVGLMLDAPGCMSVSSFLSTVLLFRMGEASFRLLSVSLPMVEEALKVG